MRRKHAILAIAAVGAFLAVGCDSILGDFSINAETADSGGPDAQTQPDATVDAADANVTAPDAGQDSTLPDAGPDVEDAGVDSAEAAPSCINVCVPGETQCAITPSGNVVQTCQLGADPCTEWVTTKACAVSQSCGVVSGTAQCVCAASYCTGTGATCQDQQTLATCANDPTTGCLYPTSTTACTGANVCGGLPGAASCAATCKDSCTAGATTCVNGAVATCAKQADNCLAYGAPKACADNQVCTGAAGSAKCSCENDTACDGLAGRTCTQGLGYVSCAADTNKCLVATPANCNPDQACSGDAGTATCACQNPPICNNKIGFTCTDGGAYVDCTATSDTCLAATPGTCGANATCSGTGAVSPPCTCDKGYSGDGGACAPTSCFINNVPYAAGVPDPSNACQSCQPTTSVSAWTPIANGQACGAAGSGQTCTGGTCLCPSSAPTLCGVMCSSAASCATTEVCSGGVVDGAENELSMAGSTAYFYGSDAIYTCPTGASSAAATVYVDFPKPPKLLFSYVTAGVGWDGTNGVYYTEHTSTGTFSALFHDSPPSGQENGETYSTTSNFAGIITTDPSTHALFLQEGNGIYLASFVGAEPDGGYPDIPCLTENTAGLVSAAAGYVVSFDSGAGTLVGASATQFSCGTQTTIATATVAGAVTAIATDGTSLYFANASGVYACPLTGCGAVAKVLAASQGTVDSIVVDSSFAYWAGSSGLVGCYKSGCGGTPTPILAGVAPTFGMGLDATNIYYFDDSSGNLYRIPK